MWFHILLSALAFNLSFLFPDYLGFLIVLCPIPLIFFLRLQPGPWACINAGGWWGVCVFGIHFIWLFELLLTQSQAGWLLSGVIYGIVVAYFALSSACWLVLAGSFWSIPIFLITIVVYWICIENWIFIPPGLGMGYPFLNPCIPLSSYTTFLKLLAFITMSPAHHNSCPMSFIYVAPVINRIKNTAASWRSNPEAVGQKVYHQLCKYQDAPAQSLYVTPETTFPFPLNHYSQITDLWSMGVSQGSHFLVGSIIQEGEKVYQAVFWLHEGLIINVYVKKMLTPFVEKIPVLYKDIKVLKKLFLAGHAGFCDDTDHMVYGDTEFFDVTPTLRIIPRICLEFFFQCKGDFERYKDPSKNTVIFFFANDSWFNSFFRTILERLVIIKAHWIGLPVVYVGHFGCKVL